MQMRTTAVGLVALVSFFLLPEPACAVDVLNTNLTMLVSLDLVERALFCGEHEAVEKRTAILRVIGELERCGFHDWKDCLTCAPEWAPTGIKNGQQGLSFAYARLLKNAGVLYGNPEYVARGRRMEERIIHANGGAPDFRDESETPVKVRDYYRLMERNRADLANTIRAGGENGRNFWNGNARLFIYPPSFDFKGIEGAYRYRFKILDDVHRSHAFEADRPTASLSPVWAELPIGFVTVECRAIDANGRDLGVAGARRFWRSAPFDPVECKPAKRTYGEAYRMVLDNLFNWPEIVYLEAHGTPDIAQGSNFTSYPSKMQEAVIRVMLAVAREFPERRERALKIARISADYLLSTREGPGTPLEGFTATYVGNGQTAGRYSGQHMLVYPAGGGSAFLNLYRETREEKYLEAAKQIGNTYLRLQGEDGTWYLKMNAKDGTPVSPNRLVPTAVMEFFEKLYEETKDDRFRAASDRAFASIDRGPLIDWDWEGQFEDIEPSKKRYQNLTKHMPCDTALYMLRRFPGDKRRLAQARDIVRFAEDQFVMWRAPCRPDGTASWTPTYQFLSWRTPAALEQYNCYSPIDSSAVKLVRTYLALYRAEGNPLDLAKARALGDSIVNNQDDNGRIRTYWIPENDDKDDPLAGAVRQPLGGDWYNCMSANAIALSLLIEEETRARCRMDRSRLQIGTYSLSKSAMTEAHVKDMRDCGIDFVIGPGVGNRGFLDACARHGLGVVVSGAVDGWWGGHGENAGTMHAQRPIEKYVSKLSDFKAKFDHPAIWCIDIGDEPSSVDFPHYGKVAATVNAALPECPSYLNVYPNYGILAETTSDQRRVQLGTSDYGEYVSRYCRDMPLDYFCFDYYPYYDDAVRTREMIAGLYDNFRTASAACRTTDRSLWYVAQVNSRPKNVRALTVNNLRFQAYSALAFGAEVVTWACWSPGWWTNNVLTPEGKRTEQYDRLRVVNSELHALGPSYMRFRNVATHFIGGDSAASELDASGIAGLSAVDGSPLLVGEMVARKCDDGARALLIVAAGDPLDEQNAKHEIRLRVKDGFTVSCTQKIAVPDGTGLHSFRLSDNSCALLSVTSR